MVANQSRHHGDFGAILTASNGFKSPKVFSSEPLDPNPDEDSIRLVQIEPAKNHHDALSCKLIHVTFAGKPVFKALSYMWGDEAGKADIFLNHYEFSIGQNLWDALHFLRSSGDQTPFWIDGLCIDQGNIPERNKQLAMMKWIYFRQIL